MADATLALQTSRRIMLLQATIQVPRGAWPWIGRLLDTPVDEIQSLAAAVEQSSPRSDVEDLAEELAELASITTDTAETILALAINVHRLSRELGQPAAETLALVTSYLGSSEFPRWREERAAEWEARLPLLERLVVSAPVTTMTKARELLYEFQCVLQRSAVITDVRYVYDDPGDRILGGLVLHTLSFEYSEGDERRQIHITLSPKQLGTLSGHLSRAQRKAGAAEKVLATTKIPELTPKRNLL
jgi:hypothetical protein